MEIDGGSSILLKSDKGCILGEVKMQGDTWYYNPYSTTLFISLEDLKEIVGVVGWIKGLLGEDVDQL